MHRTKSRRIQTTIALAFAVLVLATALIMAILSYSFTQEAVESTSLDFTAQLIAQVQTNIDSYITHMKNIADVVQVNAQVQELFGTDGSPAASAQSLTAADRSRLVGSIAEFLDSILRTRNDISLILIARKDGEYVIHDPSLQINPAVNVTDSRFFRAALAQPGQAVVSSSHVQNLIAGDYRWVITLSRTIDTRVPGDATSVLFVDLNFSVINDLVNRISLGNRGYLFIIDSEGGIVYHPRQELIYSGLEREYIDRVLEVQSGSFPVSDDRGDRIYTVSTSTSTGWRIVGVNHASELVPNRTRIRRYYTYGALICVVLAIVIAVMISHRVSRPILQLRGSMQRVEQGDFDLEVDVPANNEIGDLARDFNIMVAQIRELMRRNAEEHEQKRRSELMALQNQITPHFLYNTLDSIIWMAEGKQYENVVTTVASLARLLRLSVGRGDELVSIRDEIDHIKSYLTIQKLRYRDRLDFSIDVDESILRLRTPKVILQPLVENAIYHGIKNKEGGGHVTVRAGRCDGRIVLSVGDDGVGMSEEQMRTVLELTPDEADATAPRDIEGFGAGGDGSHSGRRARVGVRNVHERVRLYFGEPYGLAFRTNNGCGTIVDVHLPVISSEDTA